MLTGTASLEYYCRSSYHGYWAKDIWALNDAFGTEADLIELSAALHQRGMVRNISLLDAWRWSPGENALTLRPVLVSHG